MRRSSSDMRHFIIVGILTVVGTIFMTLLLKFSLPLPTQASTQALTVDRVFDVHIILVSFFFSLVMVFMLYSLVVFRRRAGDDRPGEHFEGNTVLEIVWTVVPLLIVFGLMALGVTSLNKVTKAQDNEAVVHVQGFQWSWAFEYPGDMISPELVLAVDQPVRMEMTSKDVIHSFWIPEMRVKQDLVPGRTTVVRITPREVGEYKLRCAELCGLSHWSMLATVRVVSQEDYDAWWSEKTAAQTPALAAAPADATE